MNNAAIHGVQGITEADIANYLVNTPGFFDRHAELLATVQLTSPHGQRAVSLQERQMEMLRERIKGLEHKIVEMIRNGQDNVSIADRLHEWTRRVLLTADAAELPRVLIDDLQQRFQIPQAAIRLWDVAEAYAALPFAAGVSSDVHSLASSLSLPYCGVNAGFEASGWFEGASRAVDGDGAAARGRQAHRPSGCWCWARPTRHAMRAEMGTEFLSRIGELASAALSRLVAAD